MARQPPPGTATGRPVSERHWLVPLILKQVFDVVTADTSVVGSLGIGALESGSSLVVSRQERKHGGVLQPAFSRVIGNATLRHGSHPLPRSSAVEIHRAVDTLLQYRAAAARAAGAAAT